MQQFQEEASSEDEELEEPEFIENEQAENRLIDNKVKYDIQHENQSEKIGQRKVLKFGKQPTLRE